MNDLRFSRPPSPSGLIASLRLLTLVSAYLLPLVSTATAADRQQGDVDPSFRPGPHTGVFSLIELSDGKIVAGTHFASGGLGGTSLARLNPDGGTDETFKCRANNVVVSFSERPDGRLFFGAETNSTIPDHMDMATLGLVSKNGTLESIHLKEGRVDCFMGLNNGSTLVSGNFQFFGERRTFRNSFARLASDGSVDESFDANVRGRVDSFAVQADGKIVIGGRIENIRGVGRNGVARLLPEGTIDPDFHPGWTKKRPFKRSKAPENTGTNGTVFCILLQPDGKILLGGEFTAVAGARRNLLARLHPDGRLDEAFNPMIGGGTKRPAPGIYSMALQTDGKIIIGGDFTNVKGVGRNNLARLLPNGNLDPMFYPCPEGRRFRDNRDKAPEDTGAKGRVHSISLQEDGKVLVGGLLFGVGGLPNGGMARLLNEPATSEVRRTETGSLQWLRGGSSPEIEQVVLEQRDGESWKMISPLTRMTGGWQAAEAPAGGGLRLRGTGRGGQNCGSTFFVVEEVSSTSTTESR